MAYGPSELDQSQTTSISDIGINNFAVQQKWGQSFTPGKTGKLDFFIWKLKKSGSPTGTLTGTLHADNGGEPAAGVLSTSSTVNVAGISTSAEEITFQFPDDYEMQDSTLYWMVLTPSYATSGANYINFRYNNTGSSSYAGGNTNRYDSDLVTWKGDQGAQDLYFKEYILPLLPAVGGKPIMFSGGLAIG